jgi:hypothetical protein
MKYFYDFLRGFGDLAQTPDPNDLDLFLRRQWMLVQAAI